MSLATAVASLPVVCPTEPDLRTQDASPDAPPVFPQADAIQWQEALRQFYDVAPPTGHTGWARYYYARIQERLAKIVEPNARVLDIGCGTGELLASLRPSVGVGVDFCGRTIREARRRHPALRFVQLAAEEVHRLGDTFDYVVVCQVLGEIYDLQSLFRAIHPVCHERTRLLIVHYNRVWQPLLRLAEWLRAKNRTPEQNWLPADEVGHLLRLSGFEPIRTFGMTVAPLYVPLISRFLNRFVGNLPWIHTLGLNYIAVARPMVQKAVAPRGRRVSVIVPARNEAGHIQPLLARLPKFAPEQEVIFVEGGSSDETWNVIRNTTDAYRGPLILKRLQQPGRGKGDAVRAGIRAATGDVLCILDADLSVPPEELPVFYDALIRGRGEFINGSRMVYLMDRRAMRFLNLLGNKVFGWIFTYLLAQRFRDTLCGTKMLRRDDYERIAANRRSFGDFDPFGDFDLLFGAARLNLKIVDLPVHYKSRVYGETNISRFRHGWLLLKMCVLAARKIKFI